MLSVIEMAASKLTTQLSDTKLTKRSFERRGHLAAGLVGDCGGHLDGHPQLQQLAT